MWLHEEVQELTAPRDTGPLPYPPGEGDKEARDRQHGLGVLEGTGYWGCRYQYQGRVSARSGFAGAFTCKLHLFVTEATNPHAGNLDHGGTAASTGSPGCYRTLLVSTRSFCLEIRKIPIS